MRNTKSLFCNKSPKDLGSCLLKDKKGKHTQFSTCYIYKHLNMYFPLSNYIHALPFLLAHQKALPPVRSCRQNFRAWIPKVADVISSFCFWITSDYYIVVYLFQSYWLIVFNISPYFSQELKYKWSWKGQAIQVPGRHQLVEEKVGRDLLKRKVGVVQGLELREKDEKWVLEWTFYNFGSVYNQRK